MFKKTNRLTKVEFSEFFKKGKKNHFPNLTIITYPSTKTKVSVVVGKKVAKSAVRRNIIKRRIYAVLRSVSNKKDSFGVVIIVVKPGYNSLSRKTAEEFLQESIAQVIKGA
jgi:ribonuclease P protein component